MLIMLLLGLSHFICDYTIVSTPKMLKAKSIGSPMSPIVAHGAAHGLIVFLIILSITRNIMTSLLCFIVEMGSHSVIDTLKGKCNIWFESVKNPANRSHWFLFGLDQYLHFVIILIIWNISK